jgi:hypothetical protein
LSEVIDIRCRRSVDIVRGSSVVTLAEFRNSDAPIVPGDARDLKRNGNRIVGMDGGDGSPDSASSCG